MRLSRRLFGQMATQIRIVRTQTTATLNAEECSWALPGKMKGWHVTSYGDLRENVKFNDSISLPKIVQPNDVMVEVYAASVNPMDIRMIGGYGATLLNAMRLVNKTPEFPLTVGRDFSGVVRETGRSVKRFKPGDQVWGAIGPHQQGTHAEYTLASEYSISKKPKSLDHVEAASVPYAAITAYTALRHFADITPSSAPYQRVLILGGAGGVGTIAIQLLKAWGAEVTVTAATDAVELVTQLGADHVVDYTMPDWQNQLQDMEGFDVVLHGVKSIPANFGVSLLKSWANAKCVTILSPLLSNFDAYGLPCGFISSVTEAGFDTMTSLKEGKSLRWAFFAANGDALKTFANLVDKGKIRPVVEKVFPFDQLPDAYDKMLKGHARGKTVIKVKT